MGLLRCSTRAEPGGTRRAALDAVANLLHPEIDLTGRDGKIGWMRALCSGFRPIE